jgi:hypothetical protein
LSPVTPTEIFISLWMPPASTKQAYLSSNWTILNAWDTHSQLTA